MQTLADYFAEQKTPENLAKVILTIAEVAQKIAQLLRRGALNNILGAANQINIQGEEQKKLDVLSNELFIEAFKNCPFVRAIASEEMPEPLEITPNAPFLLLFDPLDGSSNIDINAPVGTIFSILPADDSRGFLQPGRNQIAAGYVLYSAATEMALTLGCGTDIFLLDSDSADFVLITEKIKIAEDTQEFAINASNQRFWTPPIAHYIAELLAGKTGARGKDFNMRWVAAMVADIHRVLHRGGVFLYPIDSKNKDKGGRLRLLYEANPMSFLITQANGAATTGDTPILNVIPQKLHQRVSVILGAKNEIQIIENLFKNPR